MKFNSNLKNSSENIVKKALKTNQVVSVKVGPNNVHDILDSLTTDH